MGSSFLLPSLHHCCLQLDGRKVETEVTLLVNGLGNRPVPFKLGEYRELENTKNREARHATGRRCGGSQSTTE
jgi:hypothetical protein